MGATGGGQTLSLLSTPTSLPTSPSPRSTGSCSWCSCRRKPTLLCPGTTSWWPPPSLSCTITPRATDPSFQVSLSPWLGSTSSTCECISLMAHFNIEICDIIQIHQMILLMEKTCFGSHYVDLCTVLYVQ